MFSVTMNSKQTDRQARGKRQRGGRDRDSSVLDIYSTVNRHTQRQAGRQAGTGRAVEGGQREREREGGGGTDSPVLDIQSTVKRQRETDRQTDRQTGRGRGQSGRWATDSLIPDKSHFKAQSAMAPKHRCSSNGT